MYSTDHLCYYLLKMVLSTKSLTKALIITVLKLLFFLLILIKQCTNASLLSLVCTSVWTSFHTRNALTSKPGCSSQTWSWGAVLKKKPDGERCNMGYDSMMVKFKNRQNGAMICRAVYTSDQTSKARHGEQGSAESGGFWGKERLLGVPARFSPWSGGYRTAYLITVLQTVYLHLMCFSVPMLHSPVTKFLKSHLHCMNSF